MAPWSRLARGERHGGAAVLHQIGLFAWKKNRREIGIRLVGIAFGLLSAINAAEEEQTQRHLDRMAAELGLDQTGLGAILREGAGQYIKDRAAALVRQAFGGSDQP